MLRICLVLVAVASAGPASADALWRGTAQILSAGGTCANYNPTGSFFTARFKPRILGGNGLDSHFSWFEQDNAKAFDLPNASFDRVFRKVVYTSAFAGSGVSNASTVRFQLQAPTAITPSTPLIQAVGQITNFDFMTGCTVNFKMVLMKDD